MTKECFLKVSLEGFFSSKYGLRAFRDLIDESRSRDT